MILLVPLLLASLPHFRPDVFAYEYTQPVISELQQYNQPNQSYPIISFNNYTAVESRDTYPSPSHGWSHYAPQPPEQHHHHHSQAPAGWGWNNNVNNQHQHDFRSYFDIALTALAFLSFGIFLLNLLLNALLFSGLLTGAGTGTGGGGTVTYTYTTGGNPFPGGTTTTTTGGGGTTTGGGGTQTQTYTTFPTSTGITTVTSTGTTGTGIGIGRATARDLYNATKIMDEDVKRRQKKRRERRELFEPYLDPMSSVDLIALNVLKSIDAMLEKHECMGKVFCDSNHQAQIIRNGFQFLMPLCSVSASFISKKFGWHKDLWDHLVAVLLGVSETNCQSHFPHC